MVNGFLNMSLLFKTLIKDQSHHLLMIDKRSMDVFVVNNIGLILNEILNDGALYQWNII